MCFVYKVEKSKHEMKVAFPLLLSPKQITSEKFKHCLLWEFTQLKIDVETKIVYLHNKYLNV